MARGRLSAHLLNRGCSRCRFGLNIGRMEIELSARTRYLGRVAIIDDEDLPLVAGYTWYAARRNNKVYAEAYAGQVGKKRRYVAMHRLILQTPDESETDHKDGDGLNNRRPNLRVATAQQNQANRGPQANNTSGFKGVCLERGRWKAFIKVDRVQRTIGRFATREEAARAYDDAAQAAFGEFAYLNLP